MIQMASMVLYIDFTAV